MNQEGIQTNRQSIEEVRNRFECWRKARGKRTTIPEPLWQAAVGLSKDYPISQISKALRLSYADLKERIQESASNISSKAIKGPSFIEFDLTQRHCIVEMENPNGARMRICIDGTDGIDLLKLSKLFWNMRS
jgi:hypothetical protein